MHEILFEKMSETWATSGEALIPLMLSHGQATAGLDMAAFEACVKNRETLPKLKAVDAEQRKWGIVSQPMFELGNGVGNSGKRLAGSQSIEVFAAAIDAALPGKP
ncbi:MAG: hypothetical protein HC853_10425 [Anaerolineae bacterium]|nr:hypothetical protein [Anaerolineae bacterium]